MYKKLRKVLCLAYFTFFIMIFFTMPVSAYIDPATTAMLTQIVAGIFITLGVTLGIFRRKIFMFFKNLSVKHTAKKIQNKNKNK